jgi:hypothetical protein
VVRDLRAKGELPDAPEAVADDAEVERRDRDARTRSREHVRPPRERAGEDERPAE